MSELKYIGRNYDFDENYNNYSDSYLFYASSQKKSNTEAPTDRNVCLKFVNWCSTLDRFVEVEVTDFTDTLNESERESFNKSINNKAQVLHNMAADFDCYFTVDNTLIRSAEQTEMLLDLTCYHPVTD